MGRRAQKAQGLARSSHVERMSTYAAPPSMGATWPGSAGAKFEVGDGPDERDGAPRHAAKASTTAPTSERGDM
jgi:hypothetical protein